MDDQNKKPINDQNAQTIQPQIPQQPISGGHKEHAPIRTEETKVEYVHPSEVEPRLPQEVKEAGVEVNKPPTLPQVVRHSGVALQGEAIPAGQEPAQEITLPLTSAQATQAIHDNNTSDSIFWIASILIKLIKKRNRKELTNYD